MTVITINPDKVKPTERRVTYAEWRALFTENELQWAFDVQRPATIRDAIALATAQNSVNLNSKATSDFLDLCITLGSPITPARKADILAGNPPPA